MKGQVRYRKSNGQEVNGFIPVGLSLAAFINKIILENPGVVFIYITDHNGKAL